jgi:enamine deaminase RidA (YjgF/YER057c/UK114 family)
MNALRVAALLCLAAVFVSLLCLGAPQKKNKEEETQKLDLPKELPMWVEGETRRLTFHTTRLTNRGLLSQQIRDSLKELSRQTRKETVLKIRAFVAGSGDMRRVRDLVSDTFTDRHQPLPVLSLVRAGALPLEGAQVVMEVIASSRKEVNPDGLVFVSAEPATSDNPMDRVPPLTAKTLAALRGAVQSAGSQPADVLRVTCFFSSLEDIAESRKLVEAEYPRAALDYVQTQRSPIQALAACEAVARQHGGAEPLQFGPGEPGHSRFARVASRRVVLTGTQSSYGYEEKDARLAFERLQKGLEQAGLTARGVAFAHYYPLSPGIAAQIRKVRLEFFDPAHPPAGTLLIFEGLPSMDSGFAVDAVAIKE